MQVFVEHGYHGTSMDDIAVAAQVSKPVLYQHFPGKHELFMDLLQTQVGHLSSVLTEAMGSTDENKERVRATIRAYFQFMDRSDRAYRLLFDSGLNNDPAVSELLDSLTHEFSSEIAAIITADTRLPREHALLLGHGLAGMVQAAARYWATQPEDAARPTLEEASDLAFRLSWRGISRFPKELVPA